MKECSEESQRENMNRSPIANRSFLHGTRRSFAPDKLVYATLDSLALKRVRLPLQLVPLDDEHSNGPLTKSDSSGKNVEILSSNPEQSIDYDLCDERENSMYSTVIPSIDKLKPGVKKTESGCLSIDENLAQCQDSDCCSEDYEKIEVPACDETLTTSGIPQNPGSVLNFNLMKDSPKGSSIHDTNRDTHANLSEDSATADSLGRSKKKRKKKKKHFAKSVLREYFVPSRLVKRPTKKKRRRKQRQDSSPGPPLNSQRVDATNSHAKNSHAKNSHAKAEEVSSRRKSLFRAQSTNLSISSPTNFVHVASATTLNLTTSESSASWSNPEKIVITYKEKCATLPPLFRRSEGQYSEYFSVTSPSNDPIKINSSKIKGRTRSKSTIFSNEQNKPLANSSFLWSSRVNISSPPKESRNVASDDDKGNSDAEQYDDVLPTPRLPFQELDAYDDVGVLKTEDQSKKINEEKLDLNPRLEGEPLDETYDDVMVTQAAVKKNSTEPKKHLSISSSSSSSGNEYSSVEELHQRNLKEFDHEDDDLGVYDDVGFPKLCEERVNSLYYESEWEDFTENPYQLEINGSNHSSDSWKSTGLQRIPSRKKFNQIKRTSRKIVRQRPKRTWRSGQEKVLDPRRSVSEDDATDTSNYESLCSLYSENHESETNTETQCKTPESTKLTDPEIPEAQNINENRLNDRENAPTKPIPPPPREASLTESLGKRIKMLRRTWSITKGSIGRMKRRTSVEVENGCEDGKYFGLARHFRKSTSTLSNSNANSTFYLERGALLKSPLAQSSITTDRRSQSGGSPLQEVNLYANCNTYENLNVEIREASALQVSPHSRISSGVCDHYSILSEQEPLYQFYAAAAARVAYDSNSDTNENGSSADSDGYEQVRGTTPSKATTELAKPGHRTLWCQTPQVIGSDLLRNMSPDAIKLQEAKFEILTSEASYLNSLRVLEKEFLGDSELTEQVLNPVDKKKLFGFIPNVLQTSETFLADLESVWRSDPMLQGLPDVLLNHAQQYSDAYVKYCTNQVSIDATFKDLRNRKGSKFVDAISRIEARPSCQSLSLHSFLMLPMQRVTRLPLLADAVLTKLPVEDVAGKRSWENILATFSHIVAECNEAARVVAQEAEIEQLANTLDYSVKIESIPLKGKHLIKSGTVVQLLTKADAEYKHTFGRKLNKLPLHLFLLTDYLLITKRKTNTSQEETFLVTDVCKRNLVALESVPDDSAIAGARNAMVLTLLENHCGQQADYLLSCDSITERERWLEAVSVSDKGRIGETLYEAWDCPQVVALYSYSPCQPDELLLQPGDVMNVLKKMPDGWYQGEKLLNGEQGWFPGNYTKEVASEHVRAKNLKQRHRLLALRGNGYHKSGR